MKVNIEKMIYNGKIVAVVTGDTKVITDVQSALDLIMTVKYEAGTSLIAIDKNAVADSFFVLSSGLAGAVLGKFITYRTKIAIYGDYSQYTSKPLHDFIYESNQGSQVFFPGSREDAARFLTR